MKTIRTLLSFVFPVSIALISCEPVEKVSEIPEIDFKSFSEPYIFDIDGFLRYSVDATFSFTDGDSDIGENVKAGSADTINLVFLPYQKINGVYEPVDSALYSQQFTIKNDPKLDRPDAPIKGEITVVLGYIIKPPFDTLRYDFYLLDRARHKSNVETTSDVAF